MPRQKKPSFAQRMQARDHEDNTWSKMGLTEFRAAGFKTWQVARHWKAAGWTDPSAALTWYQATRETLMADEALAWQAAGFTPDEAAKWSQNWSLDMAIERRRTGYTPRKYVMHTQQTR